MRLLTARWVGWRTYTLFRPRRIGSKKKNTKTPRKLKKIPKKGKKGHNRLIILSIRPKKVFGSAENKVPENE
jgi:hypothetical protein